MSRQKGVRIERELVNLHHAHGIAACKESRTGYTGHDILVADTFRGEVKARSDGGGFKQLEKWLAGADLLYLRRDRARPLVLMQWGTYLALVRDYKGVAGDQEVSTVEETGV